MIRLRASAALALAAATAAAPSWRFANDSAFEGQQSFGLSFVSKSTGIVAGQLAIGAAVYATSDGAATWAPLEWTPLDFTDTAATASSLVVCADLFVQFSLDLGKTWNASVGDGEGINGCTTVRRAAFDAKAVAIVGNLGLDGVNAVAMSTDGGISFTRHDASAALTCGNALYGAFPNASTWFVTAGSTQPNAGQIAVTRNGGKSFELVHTASANFVILGIDCASGDECCALASSGSVAEVICTYDSGARWSTSFRKDAAGGQVNLNDIRYDPFSRLFWAVGGVYQTGPAWVLRSTPDFKNFTIDTELAGAYGTAIDVAADGSGAMFGIVFETDPNDDSNDNYIITNLPKKM